MERKGITRRKNLKRGFYVQNNIPCPNKEHTIFLSKNAMCDDNMPHQSHCAEHRNMHSDFFSKFYTE